MNDPGDPPLSLSRSFGFLTKIKYGGVLGKITAVAACFFVTLCVLTIASWRNPFLLGGIALIAVASLVFLIFQMRAIFEAHADLVTLEGKEIIEYRRLELRWKGKPPLAVEQLKESPALPPLGNLLMFPEPSERKDN